MIKILLKHKWYFLLIVVLMIMEPTINSVLNFWLQSLFNSAIPGADKIYILRLLTGGFMLWVVKRLVSYGMAVLKDRYICNMKRDMKSGIFTRLLSKNTANISEIAASGEYISMFTNDITLLEQRFFDQIMGLISAVFSITILGYSFVVLNAKLAVAIIGFGVLTMIVPVGFSKILNAKNMEYSHKISRFTQKLKEFIVAYPTIKNYSIEGMISDKFNAVNDETEDSKFEADSFISLANGVGQLLAWFMQFIGVGLGIMLVIKGEILIGTVVATQGFASDLAMPIQNIIININSIRSVKNIVDKLNDVADKDSADKQAESERIEPATQECEFDISFNGLTLNKDGRNIVDNFSFDFESGKKYLVIGLNGAGKSTVFKALKNWYSDCTGEITINGRSIKEFTNKELSGIVSYMNENVSLFSGTVADNISLFRSCDNEMLEKAIEGAHMNLDTCREISGEGRNVSSGEQRRIEIARTLLKSASVLVFDEVVSTLDIETAYDIEKTAMELKDKTIIFISHNFSGKLIRDYDCILIMNSGRLEAFGTYEELMKTSSYFKRICEIKFG